jgi:hypothetical protein
MNVRHELQKADFEKRPGPIQSGRDAFGQPANHLRV